MAQTEEKIEIRDTPMQEIIGRTPGWITRWGITVVLGFLIMLIIFASVFRYPDSVKSDIIITTENPPANLMAHASGSISKLLVADNQPVEPGDLLAIIHNPARYDDVMRVRQWTDSMMADTAYHGLAGASRWLLNSFQLGEIQPNLSACLNYMADFASYRSGNPEQQRITALEKELDRYGDLNRELAMQSGILKKEVELIRKQHERNVTLHASGTISDADLEKSESALLAKDFGYGEARVALANNRLKEAQVKHEMLTLKAGIRKELLGKERAIRESLSNLSAAIATWESHYVLKAPVTGRVSFSRVWNENQPVMEGDLVMTVIPVQQGDIIGKIKLPMEGAGKVEEGQRVVIKLDNYPYLEFGMLNGTIHSIAAAPDETSYMVKVSLRDSLLTTYGRMISFRQEMQGNAEIITGDMTLMMRIFNPIRHVVSRHGRVGRGNR